MQEQFRLREQRGMQKRTVQLSSRVQAGGGAVRRRGRMFEQPVRPELALHESARKPSVRVRGGLRRQAAPHAVQR